MKSMMRMAIVVSLVAVSVAQAQSAFKLGTAVPADSMVYVHGVHNPKSEFIYKHWGHVMDAVCAAGIDEEIKQLALSNMDSDEDRKEFEAIWTQVMGLVRGVQWNDLCQQELAFYMRLEGLPEFGVLMRPEGKTIDENTAGLTKIFQAIADLDDSMTVSNSKVKGADVWSIVPKQAPIGLHLVRHKDLLAIYVTPTIDSAVGFLSGDQAAQSIVNSERFKKALGHVPAPEDSITFFDSHLMMSTIKQMAFAQMPAEDSPEYKEAKAAMGLFDHLDVFDYIINSERTDGLQNFQHTYTAVLDGAKDRPLVQMITRQGALDDFSKMVPKDASSFMAWAGVDLEFAYDTIVNYIKTEVPDGAELIADWDKEQADMGFDLKKDLLSWISGQFIGVELPPAVATPMGSGDAVMMFKVRDSKRAMEQVNGWIDALNAQMGGGGGGQALMISDATGINAEGFRTVNHPMLMAMGIGFAYGVKDDWFMLGMGGAVPALNKCLETGQGAESFLASERYKKEGLKSKNPPMWVSFSDLSTMGQDMSMALGFLPMASAFMPPTPETQPVRAVFNILGKLAPALAQIDFLVSEAVVSSWTGQGWESTTKMTYSAYTPKESPTGSDKASESDLDGL